MITTSDVRSAINTISNLTNDPEAAHARTDDLYLHVLEACASGKLTKQQMIDVAAEAVKAQLIKFPRWCA